MKQVYLNSLDIPQIHRFAVGFDRMFDELARTAGTLNSSNYPPYNIVRVAENEYEIEVAVAGFSENELDVEMQNGELVVKGEAKATDTRTGNYLHQGIAARNFTRTFALPDNSEVKSASVKNGILTVNVEVFIPESTKKKIAIAFEK